MKAKLLMISIALAFLILSARTGVTQSRVKAAPAPEWLRTMFEQGWHEVQKGVLERRPGGNRLEVFTYGEAGRHYAAQHLEDRIDSLERELSLYPSEELEDIVTTLKGERAELERMQSSTSAAQGDALIDSSVAASCIPTVIYHADASPLPGAQGPGATASADASFYSSCGELANVYTYAYARATEQNTTNVQSQEEPIYDGTSLYSDSTATVKGSVDCYSEAAAQIYRPSLEITYSDSKRNYVCTDKRLIVPAAAGESTSSGYFPMQMAFDAQPTLSSTGVLEGGVGGYDVPTYENRTGYIDFGPEWDKVRITSTWTQYRVSSIGDQIPYSEVWWDDDIDSINDSGLLETGVNFNSARNLSTGSTEPWKQDRDFSASPVKPKARYLLCRTASITTGRAKEYAIVGFIETNATPPKSLIAPAAAGATTTSGYFPMDFAFDAQPTLNAAEEPVGGAGGNDAAAYGDRSGYIDFGPDWAKVRITSTWTQYRVSSTGDQIPYSEVWWDDDIDGTNDSGLLETGVNFGTARGLSTGSTEPWIRDRDFSNSPVAPKARYLLCRTPSITNSRAKEYAIVGYIQP